MSWDCLPMSQLFGLMDSFSIIEASALIAGKAPDDVQPEYDINGNPYGEPYILTNASEDQKTVYTMALNRITRAIESGTLKALIQTTATTQLYKTDVDSEWKAKYFLSPSETRINRDDLVRWLDSRSCYPSFFFNNSNEPLYLVQQNNPQYSPKLCAIVHAWEVTKEAEETNQLNGLSVKQFASIWLEQNAYKYGVEGVTNFDDMASIINWNTKGGRISDKPSVKSKEPSLPIGDRNKDVTQDNRHHTIIDSLVIEKNDLKTNPYRFSSNMGDSDLPF